MIHIGFTGTRHGMTEQQHGMVPYALTRITLVYAGPDPFIAHHGDCVGSDSQFHKLCRARWYRVVGHPRVPGLPRSAGRGMRRVRDRCGDIDGCSL